MKTPHIPVPIITHNGGLIIAAAKTHPEIATRLTAAAIAAADTLCTKVSGDVTGQKGAKGELGNLTLAQQKNLNTLHQCMAQAAKTAKLAFPGQTVKLHQEFQIGVHDKNDLGSYLGRVDIVLGSVEQCREPGRAEGQGLDGRRDHRLSNRPQRFWPRRTIPGESTSGAKDTTTKKNTAAATLYENVLTIQNAADLQWPAADPANAGVRGEFLLGIFPPDHGGNHTPPPPPPAPQTPPTK